MKLICEGMEKDRYSVLITGARGMVGSAFVRGMTAYDNVQVFAVGREELDLCDPQKTDQLVGETNPDLVIHAAAKVGGIWANDTFRSDFLMDNLALGINIVRSCYKHNVGRLLNLGSSCIYPKITKQPIKEEFLLTGSLEPTNESYAIAKIAVLKLCESFFKQKGSDFRSVMPCNLYGPGDNFDLRTSHVIPALISKAITAIKSGSDMEIWGSGTVRREFLHVDDLIAGSLRVLAIPKDVYWQSINEGISFYNVGSGEDIQIIDLAKLILEILGATETKIILDRTMPDGTPSKTLCIKKVTGLGFEPKIKLKQGLKLVIDDYLKYGSNRVVGF